MSGSEDVSSDSHGSLVVDNHFIALGFHREAKNGEHEINEIIPRDKGDEKDGRYEDTPLKLPRGEYELRLHDREEEPKNPYCNEKWHFTMSSAADNASKEEVEIHVLVRPNPAEMWEVASKYFYVTPVSEDSVTLGKMELKTTGKMDALVIGDIYRLFLSEDYQMFERRDASLMYHIEVT